MRKTLLVPGEPAPWFMARCTSNPTFHFDTVAGRYVVLCFFQSTAIEASRQILAGFQQHGGRFDDVNACFFGVSTDPQDELAGRVGGSLLGVRFFWDQDQQISQLYGAASGENEPYRPHTLVLDWRLRVLATLPFEEPQTHATRILELLDRLPRTGPPTPASVQAPILIVPRILEPELCRVLISYYEQHGGEESGFMREVAGKTVEVQDYGHKRRRDQSILDENLRKICMFRIHDRLVPEIHKAFQFQATRIERYIVACYDAETGGHFRPHRDNTTRGTAHRRFAVSLNLNTGAYEGGLLRFPEFGPQLYTVPAGGAVVFSCSLLHEATAVTKGKRYAFLPFLYDDAAAKIRVENLQYVEGNPTTSG